MTEIKAIEGGQKDVSTQDGTKPLKKTYSGLGSWANVRCSDLSDIHNKTTKFYFWLVLLQKKYLFSNPKWLKVICCCYPAVVTWVV